jgi:Mg-chelatase subunit ChlD
MRTSTYSRPRPLQLVVVLAASSLACASGADDSDDEAGISTFGSGGSGGSSSTSGDTEGETASGTADSTATGVDTETTAETLETSTDADTETTVDGSTDADTGTDIDGTATGSDVIPCDIAEAALTPVVPHVVLVLDKSGSMIGNTWDHDADPQTPEVTRWSSLHAVVSQIVNGFDDQFEFGAQLYPSKSATNEYSVDACLVEAPPEVLIAPDNAVPILLEIPTANSNNVRGGTPASSGMTSAIDHLIDVDDGNPMAIILVSDGAANCRTDATNDFERFENYDSNLATIVGDAYADLGIATYVVGIDISDVVTQTTGVNNHPPDGEPDAISPFQKLDEVAVAGGKPLGGMADFYQTQNELELSAALQSIVDDAVSCTVLLDPIPIFPDLVEVVIDDQNVPQVIDCTSEDGWVYTNPDGPYDSIELCGNWCEVSQDAMVVKAEYFCDPG